VLDAAMIAQLRGDFDASMREQLVDAFRAQLHSSVPQLQAAIEGGDETECRRLAHALRGSSATMGASRLARHCERLESLSLSAERAAETAQLREIAEEALGAVEEALAR
jgi:HPt (histidine-containing phosphotransfer) domain-containing protein